MVDSGYSFTFFCSSFGPSFHRSWAHLRRSVSEVPKDSNISIRKSQDVVTRNVVHIDGLIPTAIDEQHFPSGSSSTPFPSISLFLSHFTFSHYKFSSCAEFALCVRTLFHTCPPIIIHPIVCSRGVSAHFVSLACNRRAAPLVARTGRFSQFLVPRLFGQCLPLDLCGYVLSILSRA